MKHLKFIIMYCFDRSFRLGIENVIMYALINYDAKRGYMASDVLIFNNRYRESIFNNNSIRQVNYWKKSENIAGWPND